MTENRGTVQIEAVDDDEYTGYLEYGDGAMFALEEREGHDTINMARKQNVTVFENLEEALGKWLNYVFGSEEDGNRESES